MSNQNLPRALTKRQQCFVKNIISNQQMGNSNRVLYEKKKSNLIGNLKGKKLGQQSIQKSFLSIRRSYGSLNFNYEDKTQFNNRGSIQDNIICSDAIIKNEKKKKDEILKQKQKKNSQEKQLRKFSVNVNLYNQYLKTQQIADAYYFVDQQAEQAKKREKERQQTIKKVKSLSKSKSKEQNLQFRNKEKLNFNCIKHIEEMKQKYTKQIVPKLMGTQYQSNNLINSSNKNLLSFKTNNSIQTRETARSLKNQFGGETSQNMFQSKTSSQQGFWHSVKPTQSTSILINSQQKPSVYTSRMFYQNQNQLKKSKSKSINSNSLMKKLQKSKSTEEFLQKERVKVIKQAFIQNWRQGPNKKQEKYLRIYPCKYTQKLNQQKEKEKNAQEKHKKERIYGQRYFKKNPIQNLPESSQQGMLAQRYHTLKQYQLQFAKIAKNNVKSCIVAKN